MVADQEGYMLNGDGKRKTSGIGSRTVGGLLDKSGDLLSRFSPFSKPEEPLESSNDSSSNKNNSETTQKNGDSVEGNSGVNQKGTGQTGNNNNGSFQETPPSNNESNIAPKSDNVKPVDIAQLIEVVKGAISSEFVSKSILFFCEKEQKLFLVRKNYIIK